MHSVLHFLFLIGACSSTIAEVVPRQVESSSITASASTSASTPNPNHSPNCAQLYPILRSRDDEFHRPQRWTAGQLLVLFKLHLGAESIRCLLKCLRPVGVNYRHDRY